MKKFFTLSIAIALGTSVQADQLKFITIVDPDFGEPNMMGLGLSPDGQYVCGVIELGAGIFVGNTSTGEVKWEIVDADNGGELRHVDNNGLAVGFTNYGISYSFATGKEKTFAPPEGYASTLCDDLTENGDLIVGYAKPQGQQVQAAYTVNKGVSWNLLPKPTKEDMGALDPRLDTSQAKLVSKDGKVIYGFMGSFAVPTLWIMDDSGEYKHDFFLAPYVKLAEADRNDESKPFYGVTAMRGMAMSNNGRYVGLSALYLLDADKEEYITNPAIYDVQEKKMITFPDAQEIDEDKAGMFITAIADDGTIIGTIGQPDAGSHGSFILRGGETKAERFVDAFPAYAEKLGEGDLYGFHIPTGMSADGRYISGYAYYADDYNDMSTPAYYVTYFLDTQGDSSVEEISGAVTPATVESIYTLDGQRLREMTKGINIVKMSDGTVRKVLNK